MHLALDDDIPTVREKSKCEEPANGTQLGIRFLYDGIVSRFEKVKLFANSGLHWCRAQGSFDAA